MIDISETIFVVVSLLLFVNGVRGIKAGRFDSVYGEKLNIQRDREPVLFWIQVSIILGTSVLIGFAAAL